MNELSFNYMSANGIPLHQQLKIEAAHYIMKFKLSIVFHAIFLVGQLYAISCMKIVKLGYNYFYALYCYVDQKW